MRRPSASVTTNSVGVNSTAEALRSPTSISKVLIPDAHELITVSLEVSDNIAKFMGRIPGIQRNRKVVQPDFGFSVARTNVDMRGLIAFVGIEERAIGSPA